MYRTAPYSVPKLSGDRGIITSLNCSTSMAAYSFVIPQELSRVVIIPTLQVKITCNSSDGEV